MTSRKSTCWLRPNGLRLVVKQDGFTYSGKLVIPDKAKKLPTTGIVEAAGEGLEEWLGKRVLWNYMSGSPVQFRNKTHYFILNIEEVLAQILITDELEPELQKYVEM